MGYSRKASAAGVHTGGGHVLESIVSYLNRNDFMVSSACLNVSSLACVFTNASMTARGH